MQTAQHQPTARTRAPAPADRDEELKAAYERIAQLEADLNECREFLEGQADVNDGSYGQPAPNRAMQLVCLIDESLHGPGGV